MTKFDRFGYLPLWLTVNELATVLSVSKRTICRWLAEGRIPPPHQFTKRTYRWRRDEIFGLLDGGPCAPGSFRKSGA